jgi:hypothetical protein
MTVAQDSVDKRVILANTTEIKMYLFLAAFVISY